MNEKLQYASMLEIPVNTCSVTVAPQKKKHRKKKKVNLDGVKSELVNKVNTQMEKEENVEPAVDESLSMDNLISTENVVDEEEALETAVIQNKNKKKGFKISVIGVQLAIIGVLIASIFLTNAVYENSGINVFLREVFSTQKVAEVDDRLYSEFMPVISLDDGAEVSLTDGIISLTGRGSVYAPCDGVVTNVVKGEDGKYSVEITHSTNFKSVLSGLDYAYAGLDEQVYYNIPVGFVSSNATMCFKNSQDVTISDYQIVDNSVVWSV